MTPRPLVLAHRGANRVAPENTVAAFRAAAAMGADGVELDVRATADGGLVVCHDDTVEGLGRIAELTIRALAGGLTSLSEALDSCAGMALVNIEIKCDPGTDPVPVARAVASLLQARPCPPSGPRLLVSSFSLETIDAHRAAAPGLATGWLTAAPAAPAVLDVLAAHGHSSVHLHESFVTPNAVDAAHARGLAVAAWTVDHAARASAIAGWGADMVITDLPDVVLVALGRRGSTS